jgi:hypothetical protein
VRPSDVAGIRILNDVLRLFTVAEQDHGQSDQTGAVREEGHVERLIPLGEFGCDGWRAADGRTGREVLKNGDLPSRIVPAYESQQQQEG